MKTIFSLVILLALTLSFSISNLTAQEGSVGIGTSIPDPSAILDIVSSEKGLLIPRMTTQQMMNIENPPPGLMIFDTEKNALCAFSNETNWQILGVLPDGDPNDMLQLDENGKPYWAPFTGEVKIDTLSIGLGVDHPEELIHIRDGNLRIDNGDVRSWGPIIFLPDSDESGDSRIQFNGPGGMVKAVINEYGNFGVGTADPNKRMDVRSHAVDVSSEFQISNADQTHFLRAVSGNSNDFNSFFNWQVGNSLLFSSANSDYPNWQEHFRINTSLTGESKFTFGISKAVIDEAGNFGLGTEYPSMRMDILSKDVDEGSVLQLSNSDKSNFIRIFGGHESDPSSWFNWQEGNPLIFSTANNDFSNWSEKMRISNIGYVGIGESNPNAPLSVLRTINASDPNYLQLLHNRSNTDGASAMIGFSVADADIGFGNFTPAAVGFQRGKGLVFQVHNNSGNPPNRMEISSTGEVKVPGKVLVGEGSSTNADFSIERPTNAKFRIGGFFNAFEFVHFDPTLKINSIGYSGTPINRLTMNSENGFIGMGTENPLSSLHVNGNGLLVSSKSNANGNSYVTIAEDSNGTKGMKLAYDGTNNIFSLQRIANGTAASPNFKIDDTGFTTISSYNNTGHVMRIVNTSEYTEADGLEIKINSNTNHRNNFISFTDQTGVRGRVEGQTTIVDVLSNSVADLIADLILNVNGQSPDLLDFSGIPVDYQPLELDVQLLPEPYVYLDLPQINIGDFDIEAEFNNKVSQFASIIPDKSKFDAVWAQLGDVVEGVNVEYLVTTIILAIDVIRSIIELASSNGSVFDPEDIFLAGLNLATSSIQLGVWVGYWQFFSSGVVLQTGAGDYAEWLEKEDPNEFITNGDIVGVRAGKISKQFVEADHYMAVSTAPALAGNLPIPEKEKDFEMVAFMGQIPVKVKGKVNKGDYILPSGEGDGYAIAVHPNDMLAMDYKRVVGVAWGESSDQDFFSLINTAVGINQNDLAKVVDQMQAVMNQMQIALKEINPDYKPYLFATEHGTLPQNTELTYTVSSTHPSKVSNLFGNKTYKNIKERNSVVKEALQSVGNVDFEKVQALELILDHPEKKDEIITYYTSLLDGLQGLMNKIEQK